MLYDVTGNALLSVAAVALAPTSLAAYTTIAEALLRLNTIPVYTDTPSLTTVQAALSIQINRILDVGGDASMLKSFTQGSRSETYRDGLPLLSELSETLVQSLVGAPNTATGRFAAFTSFRPNTTDALDVGFMPF